MADENNIENAAAWADALDATLDSPVEEAAPVETAAEEQQEAPEEAEPVETAEETEEPVEAAPAEEAEPAADPDIPEDVTITDRKTGGKMWSYPEEKARRIFAESKQFQQVAEIFGEDVTPEAVELRQNAYDWQQTQRLDLLSQNPREQSRAFANIFDDVARALNNGEIAHDPTPQMAKVFAQTLQRYNPDAFQEMAGEAINQKLEDLYAEAHEAGNTKLLRAVQNLDYRLNNTYRKDDELAASVKTDIDRREQAIADREERIAQADRQQSVRAYEAWRTDTVKLNADAVKSVISTTIPQAVKDAYKGDPAKLARIERLLDIEVRESIRSDPKWKPTLENLYRRAQSGSEAIREQARKEINQRHSARARQVMQTKGASILSEELQAAKTANTATHKRHEAGTARKAPGAGIPARRELPSSVEATGANSNNWRQMLDSL